MSKFLGFAYKFVISSFFKKNDKNGCGYINPEGVFCGLERISTQNGDILPTCHQHADMYSDATEVILMEPSGDNARGLFHWEAVEKPPGMVLYVL